MRIYIALKIAPAVTINPPIIGLRISNVYITMAEKAGLMKVCTTEVYPGSVALVVHWHEGSIEGAVC
jgi:hypothetical protein